MLSFITWLIYWAFNKTPRKCTRSHIPNATTIAAMKERGRPFNTLEELMDDLNDLTEDVDVGNLDEALPEDDSDLLPSDQHYADVMDLNDDVVEAHDFCRHNKEALSESEMAGCFCCCNIFPAKEVVEWVRNSDDAICPECGIDSVIGDASGYPITVDFLRRMEKRWFDIVKETHMGDNK